MVSDLKQRIVGGVVIICVLAIFLPVILHKPKNEAVQSVPMTIPQPQSVSQLSLQLPAQQPSNVQQAAAVIKSTPATKLAQAERAITQPQQAQSDHQSPVAKINTRILQAAVTTPQAWVVQLGSFSQRANVQRLVKQLRHHGFDAYTRTQAHGTQSITQVFVGPEISRDTINKINKKLLSQFHLQGVVRKYQV